MSRAQSVLWDLIYVTFITNKHVYYNKKTKHVYYITPLLYNTFIIRSQSAQLIGCGPLLRQQNCFSRASQTRDSSSVLPLLARNFKSLVPRFLFSFPESKQSLRTRTARQEKNVRSHSVLRNVIYTLCEVSRSVLENSFPDTCFQLRHVRVSTNVWPTNGSHASGKTVLALVLAGSLLGRNVIQDSAEHFISLLSPCNQYWGMHACMHVLAMFLTRTRSDLMSFCRYNIAYSHFRSFSHFCPGMLKYTRKT